MKSPDMSFNIIRLLLEAWLYVKDSNVRNDYRIPKVTIKLLILSYASSHDNIGVKNATNYFKKKKRTPYTGVSYFCKFHNCGSCLSSRKITCFVTGGTTWLQTAQTNRANSREARRDLTSQTNWNNWEMIAEVVLLDDVPAVVFVVIAQAPYRKSYLVLS